MLNSEEEKAIDTTHSNYNYNHPLSHLYTLYSPSNQTNGHNLYAEVCGYLDILSLCRISCCNKEFNYISCAEAIWKPLCLSKWAELKMAKNLDDDPFPIYKSCFKRKASEEATSMQDLMNIFGRCDWYSCPNGHLYTIGECRMAVMMSRCPECGETIGGRFHRHLDTNYRIGAVNASYNPMRHGLKTEDKIQFEDVTEVVHKTRDTAFNLNGYGHYPLGTISEQETMDFDKLQRQFEGMEDAPEYLVCPLSLDVYIDPLVAPNGSIYERKYIIDWLSEHDSDPLDANIKLKIEDLETESDVKKAAALWRQKRNKCEENKIDNEDCTMMNGLTWANDNVIHQSHYSDDGWDSNDNGNDEEGADVNMNEFKHGLANILTSQNDKVDSNEANHE